MGQHPVLSSLTMLGDPLSDILGSEVSPWKSPGSGFPAGLHSVLYFLHLNALRTVQELTVLQPD